MNRKNSFELYAAGTLILVVVISLVLVEAGGQLFYFLKNRRPFWLRTTAFTMFTASDATGMPVA